LIGSSPRSTFAATSYLKKAGEPRTPQELARHSCIAFTFRPRWLFASELENGQVREILTKHPSDRTPIHAVFPAGRSPGGKLRAFIEFLVEAFAADPCLRPTR
jgi:DNA-binding transcriptional LysR family regulator